MDIALDTNTHDIQFDIINGRFEMALTEGVESVAQDWKIRLWTFKGEWFADQRVGMPYFQNILVKNPDMTLIGAIFRAATLSTSGVQAVTDETFDFDRSARRLTVSIEAQLESGIAGPNQTFRFTFNELILPFSGVDE